VPREAGQPRIYAGPDPEIQEAHDARRARLLDQMVQPPVLDPIGRTAY
jgi:hypothetical protein